MINMGERRYVKLKTDMYEDTKFKIIDTKPERDVIHYVWNRIVLLAGKVNLEGDLYLSKNIPYTIETLAIEFNRDIAQIKLSLDVFIKLDMVEITEEKIYRVKNFAKHQNIKVKEEIKAKDKVEEIKIKEAVEKEVSKNKINDNKNAETENKISQNDTSVVKIDDRSNLEASSSSIKKVDNISTENNNNKSQDNLLMLLDPKIDKKANKNKKRGKSAAINDEENALDNEIVCFCDPDKEKPLEEGESLIYHWLM